MNTNELLNLLKQTLVFALSIIDKIVNNSETNDSSQDNKYYCYSYYSGEYDYGGHCDKRATMFPVLQEIYTDEEKANNWLQTMNDIKSIRTAYYPRPYDYGIHMSILKLPKDLH